MEGGKRPFGYDEVGEIFDIDTRTVLVNNSVVGVLSNY